MAGMMTAVRWTQGTPDELMQHGDELMDFLMEREAVETSVADTTVTVDAQLGLLVVEVFVRREADREYAERWLLDAMNQAGFGLGEPTGEPQDIPEDALVDFTKPVSRLEWTASA